MDTPNSTTTTRVCITCGQEFPLTREFFCPVVKSRYLSRDCRACHNAAKQEYKYPEKDIARGAVYRAENKEKIAEYNREYRKRNVEQRKAYNNQWNAEHRDQVRATEKAYRENKPEVRRGIKARRRAKEMGSGGTVTTADLTAIRVSQTDKRGRLICWLCGKPIKSNPHLDHFMPIKHGGPNSAGNLHYVHARCNLHKSAKLPSEIGRLL
jgi:hypothetical protein